jgi:SulP family sulfate permease
MRRMAQIAGSSVEVSGTASPLGATLPKGVVHYEIAGALFFGATEKAISALGAIADVAVLILDLELVPVMDMTALVALESAISRVRGRGARVILYGLRPQPSRVLGNAGVLAQVDVRADLAGALRLAEERVASR